MHWLFVALLLPLQSFSLDLSGPLIQGGWIVGKTNPEHIVKISDVQVPVSKDGNFFFGFNRHTDAEVKVETFLNGEVVGSKTLLIEPRDYKTQHIKGVAKRKVNPNPDDLKQIRGDSAAIKRARAELTRLPFFTQQFSWPTSGTITGVYGSRRTFNGEERSWHKGLDIAAKTGTPIKAPNDAKVALALPNSFFNGNLIVLDHGHQMFTIYAHMDSLSVTTGQQVQRGDLLGTVGSTGRSTGPHLHWGLYWRNIALDPMLLLR